MKPIQSINIHLLLKGISLFLLLVMTCSLWAQLPVDSSGTHRAEPNGNGMNDTIERYGNVRTTDYMEVYSDNTTTPTSIGVFNHYYGQNTSGSDYEIATLQLGTSSFFSSISGKIPNGYYSDGVRLDFSTPVGSNDNTQIVRMSILPFSGQVGIGTTTPIRRFEVASDGVNWISGTFSGSGGSDKVVLGNYNGKATIGAHNAALTAWADLSLQPDGGNVGIGKPNPSEKLDINGNIKASGTIAGFLDANNAVITGVADPISDQDVANKAYITLSVSPHYDTLFVGNDQIIFIPGLSAANYQITLTTHTATSITINSAISYGNVTAQGHTAITARGICWSSAENPTLDDLHTLESSGTGSFSSLIEGLIQATPYYARAYATNAAGTSYGVQIQFTTQAAPNACPDTPTVTDADGNLYNTVLVGTQCWMRENLRIGIRINGNSEQTDNGIIEKYCYNDDPAFCLEYGGLYQWNELMQYSTTEGVQGICPDGWHLPTDAEWSTLVNLLGGLSSAGGPLKEEGTTHWYSPNTGATNSSMFTGLGAGCRYNDGSFGTFGYCGYFWTSSRYDVYTYQYELVYNTVDAWRGSCLETWGLSVRCIKND